MARKKIKLKSRYHGHVHGNENFRQSIIRLVSPGGALRDIQKTAARETIIGRVQNSWNFRGKRVSASALSRSHFSQFPFLLGDTKFSFTKKYYKEDLCLWSKRGLVLKQCDLNSQENLSTKLRRRFTLIWWLSVRRRYSSYLTNVIPFSCLSHGQFAPCFQEISPHPWNFWINCGVLYRTVNMTVKPCSSAVKRGLVIL